MVLVWFYLYICVTIHVHYYNQQVILHIGCDDIGLMQYLHIRNTTGIVFYYKPVK